MMMEEERNRSYNSIGQSSVLMTEFRTEQHQALYPATKHHHPHNPPTKEPPQGNLNNVTYALQNLLPGGQYTVATASLRHSHFLEPNTFRNTTTTRQGDLLLPLKLWLESL